MVELPFAMTQLNLAWLQHARMRWDMLNNNWNQWVLGYGQEQQSSFLARFHASLASWQGMAIAMVTSLAVLVLGIALWMLWHAPRRGSDPVQAAYRTFCVRLARGGIARAPHEGPADFALRAAQLRPELAAQIDHITQCYIGLRYGRQRDAVRALRQAVQRFRPSRRCP